MTAGRPLAELVALLDRRGLLVSAPPATGVLIAGVTMDSRRVAPGDLFVALAGARHDGHAFAAGAVASGAVAVLAEHPLAGLHVPMVVVRSPRSALACAAAWGQGFPSRDLGVVGVTGTDGKTTTAWLTRAALEACGLPTGLVGTVDVICAGHSLGNAARATTPEAPELQAYLARMRGGGDRWAVVESTSHGLALERVGEVAWDVAVLTNLGQEHLELHGTVEAYRGAKRRLFERLAVSEANPEKGFGKHAVLNADDPVSADFAAAAREAGARILTYGGDAARRPDLLAEAVEARGTGLAISMRTPRWRGRLELRLSGRFNVHNALAAMGVVECLGLDPERAASGLAGLAAVPGRMQAVEVGQPFGVVVDYAHTAEALAIVLDELALPAARAGGGLIAVFGSAGERDLVKRPRMGRVAGERCRLVVLTDEDPRREDPRAILEQIAAGAEEAGRRRGVDLLLVPDRPTAIATAFERARPGDVVLLAGKGHERTIEVAGGALPWDEASVAREALTRMGYGAAARS